MGLLVLSQQSDSGLGWHGGRQPNPPTTSLHRAGWDSLHTHSAEHLFVNPLQDGGELHSTGAMAAVTPVIFPKC